MLRRALLLLGLFSPLTIPTPAHAIRPFVTDDARVVGEGLAQLETWFVLDRAVFEHNVLAAIGPTPWLELSVGFIHGAVYDGPRQGYAITGPIMQAKALLLHADSNSWPGVALAAGALAPGGRGRFVPPGWDGFGYLALTQNVNEEQLLVHANIGFAAAQRGDDGDALIRLIGGLGAQLKLIAGLHAVAEVYYGDSYDPRFAEPAGQVGFRYIFNEHIQMDSTFGSTIHAGVIEEGHVQTEQWGTLGLRLVTPQLW